MDPDKVELEADEKGLPSPMLASPTRTRDSFMDASSWGENTSLLSSTVIASSMDDSVIEIPQHISVVNLDDTHFPLKQVVAGTTNGNDEGPVLSRAVMVKEELPSWLLDFEPEHNMVFQDEEIDLSTTITNEPKQPNNSNISTDVKDVKDIKDIKDVKIKVSESMLLGYKLNLSDIKDIKVKLTDCNMSGVKVKPNLSTIDTKVDIKNVVIKKSESILEAVKISTSILEAANTSAHISTQTELINEATTHQAILIPNNNISPIISNDVPSDEVIDEVVGDLNLTTICTQTDLIQSPIVASKVADNSVESSNDELMITVIERVSTPKIISQKADENSQKSHQVPIELKLKTNDDATKAAQETVNKIIDNITSVVSNEYVELDKVMLEEEEENKKVINKGDAKKVELGKASAKRRSIWIYHINPNSTASNLKLDLSKYGKVLTAKIVTNGEKYYGYAVMEKEEHAKACLKELKNGKLNGFNVYASHDSPKHKKPAPLQPSVDVKIVDTKTLKKKESDPKERTKHTHKRSLSPDPLTLKVESKKKSRAEELPKKESRREAKSRRSRSRSERRRFEAKRREDELKLQQQRALELQLELERRKLALEKREFERDRDDFIRLKKLEADKRRVEEQERLAKQRKEEIRKRDEARRISRERTQTRRKRSITPRRSSKSRNTQTRLNRSKTPPPRRHRDDYKDSKQISGRYNQSKRSEERRDVAPPPAPRLTNSGLNRDKIDPWQKQPLNDGKKCNQRKADFNLDRTDFPPTRKLVAPNNNRATYSNENYDRRYENYDKNHAKDNKRGIYDSNRKEPTNPRNASSDVYARSGSSNAFPRYDTPVYNVPSTYNNARVCAGSYAHAAPFQGYPMLPQTQPPLLQPPALMMHPHGHQQPVWNNRPVYKQEYSAVPEHRYDDYDKRTYFGNRKY